MKAKEFVKQQCPTAIPESHKTNGGEKYWLIREGNRQGYLASGETEAKAWANAKRFLLKNNHITPTSVNQRLSND